MDALEVAQQAVTFAREHVFERAAIQDERAILQAALGRSIGQVSASQVRQEFERRSQGREEFRTAEHAPKSAGRQYTTAAMVRMEREIVSGMQNGKFALENSTELSEAKSRAELLSRNSQLNGAQQKAAEQILASQEKIVGLDGVAGAGKTTTLAVIREGAEANGYRVEGFAPTSCAAQKLGEAGIETSTRSFILRRVNKPTTARSGSTSWTRAPLLMHDFLIRLQTNDRVLLVGDTRQHEAVEAGRPFAQLQDAGMRTAKLDEIVRQRERR